MNDILHDKKFLESFKEAMLHPLKFELCEKCKKCEFNKDPQNRENHLPCFYEYCRKDRGEI